MEYPEFKGKTAIATGAASGMALLFFAENGGAGGECRIDRCE